jgi:hypothetical protein
MKTGQRILICVLLATAGAGCSEPSDTGIIQLRGRLLDSASRPIRGEQVSVRLESPKRVDHLSSRTDSLGEFRIAIALELAPLWYDQLVVAYYERPCRPWETYETTYEFGNEPPQAFEKLAVRLVAPDKPAGRLAVGEMCGDGRQANTDFSIGIAIDELATDSVFGRFIINYSLSTRSDTGVLRGARVGDHVKLELLSDGTGSCQGVFQVEVRFLTEPNLTTARIVPPIPCVIREDSMRLVTEPFSLILGY